MTEELIDVGETTEAVDVVYSPDMSPEDKKLIADIGKQISNGIREGLQSKTESQTREPQHLSGWDWITRAGGVFALCASLWYAADSVVTTAIDRALTKEGGTVNQLIGLRSDVGYLRKDVDALMVARVFTPAATGPNPQEVKKAADSARENHVPVTPSDIDRVATPMLKNISEEKWAAVGSLLKLRSFVNTTLEDARHNIILSSDLAETKAQRSIFPKRGPKEWIELKNGIVVLDPRPDEMAFAIKQLSGGAPEREFRHFIFKGTKVVYHGGPVTMINVFCDGCDWEIDNTPNGQILATAILKPNLDTNIVIN